LLLLPGVLLATHVIVACEERLLEVRFGAAYQDYKNLGPPLSLSGVIGFARATVEPRETRHLLPTPFQFGRLRDDPCETGGVLQSRAFVGCVVARDRRPAL
jgi:hypothetical protein